MFRIGQRVTPARDLPWVNGVKRNNPEGPAFGRVYVVTGSTTCRLPPLAGEQAVRLRGVPGWYASRALRPVVDTDIGVFTEMLRTTKVREDA